MISSRHAGFIGQSPGTDRCMWIPSSEDVWFPIRTITGTLFFLPPSFCRIKTSSFLPQPNSQSQQQSSLSTQLNIFLRTGTIHVVIAWLGQESILVRDLQLSSLYLVPQRSTIAISLEINEPPQFNDLSLCKTPRAVC